jgi:hypothetical protein
MKIFFRRRDPIFGPRAKNRVSAFFTTASCCIYYLNLRINSFNKTLLDANNTWALLINDKAEFAGLIEIEIKSLENKEGEGWRIPLLNTTP